MKTATYLYCVVQSAKQPPSADVPGGLPGATAPEALPVSRGLWLVAATVPLDSYGPGPLETLLGDLDHVGRIAVAHEAVVEHFALRCALTVVPLKLFTMFSTRARAIADMASRRQSLEAAMKRIKGAEEWGIRVTARTKRPVVRAAAERGASGAAFLTAKKQARDELHGAKLAAAAAAAAAFERLTALSRDARRRSDAPAAALSRPLLDAAFLVPSSRRDSFTAAAREEADACARAGAYLTLTGPWPAYNFIQHEEAG